LNWPSSNVSVVAAVAIATNCDDWSSLIHSEHFCCFIREREKYFYCQSSDSVTRRPSYSLQIVCCCSASPSHTHPQNER